MFKDDGQAGLKAENDVSIEEVWGDGDRDAGTYIER